MKMRCTVVYCKSDACIRIWSGLRVKLCEQCWRWRWSEIVIHLLVISFRLLLMRIVFSSSIHGFYSHINRPSALVWRNTLVEVLFISGFRCIQHQVCTDKTQWHHIWSTIFNVFVYIYAVHIRWCCIHYTLNKPSMREKERKKSDSRSGSVLPLHNEIKFERRETRTKTTPTEVCLILSFFVATLMLNRRHCHSKPCLILDGCVFFNITQIESLLFIGIHSAL